MWVLMENEGKILSWCKYANVRCWDGEEPLQSCTDWSHLLCGHFWKPSLINKVSDVELSYHKLLLSPMINVPLLPERIPTKTTSLNPLAKIFNIGIFLWRGWAFNSDDALTCLIKAKKINLKLMPNLIFGKRWHFLLGILLRWKCLWSIEAC